MQRLLLKNIARIFSVYDSPPRVLKGREMDRVPVLENGWLACENGRIADFGNMDEFPGISDWKGLTVMDCAGKTVLPCFVDSHTHIVYAGNREQEFGDRLRGLSYEEIAARGGGILNSVKKLRAATEDELFESALTRLREIISQGTGAVEIKSGYGLDLESELKMLRVVSRLRELAIVPIKATFLGAHAVPPEFRKNRDGYVDHLVNEMLPAVGAEKLADFADVFCEKNYFTAADTFKILEAAAKFGIKGKVHAEQLSHSGGIQAGIKAGAVSVDHLEFCDDGDIDALKNADTIPTILPGAAFFLDLQRPPARQMIAAGLPLALASDYNPGSSPSGNMKLMMSIACMQYKLTAEEAFNAATVNSAAAMDLSDEVGCIARGRRANLLLAGEIGSVASLVYSFGSALKAQVILNGDHTFSLDQ